MNTIYIESRPGSNYPKSGFSPSRYYPEYLFSKDTIQKEKNDIYDMVRQCLIGLGLDKDNYGKENWNPLGKYIKPGDQVLIKPNWVMHFNGAKNVKENSLECLVTHPSCLRAICDYCLIALNGSGTVIIGDAPMQDCDLSLLLEKAHFNDILKFYKENGQTIYFMDFRKYQSTFNRHKVIVNKIYQNGLGIDVDMESLSMHEKRKGRKVYQVDNYNRHETKNYHSVNKHTYSINKTVLESDVIINFCKPKSHRLAGFTAAMKNMVGIAYNKASLPHRVEGSSNEGGDAYLYKSYIKKLIDKVLDRKIVHEDSNRLIYATIDRYIYCLLLIFERIFGKDPYIKGIWYGNDTIWRTVVDLNYIEKFADMKGVLNEKPQRKILNFGDMIMAGEHNGPCQPEPKAMGVLIAGEDAACMDIAICKMIGFDENKIPMIRGLKSSEINDLMGDFQTFKIKSNIENYIGDIDDVEFPEFWKFKPHDSWSKMI